MPKFNERFNEITFSIAAGNENTIDNIKISKGEESCLIWCVFYSLLAQVVEVLNIAEPADRETDKFNDLKYIFIDDPVSSLDENHLIELAVNLADLIKKSNGLQFIIQHIIRCSITCFIMSLKTYYMTIIGKRPVATCSIRKKMVLTTFK